MRGWASEVVAVAALHVLFVWQLLAFASLGIVQSVIAFEELLLLTSLGKCKNFLVVLATPPSPCQKIDTGKGGGCDGSSSSLEEQEKDKEEEDASAKSVNPRHRDQELGEEESQEKLKREEEASRKNVIVDGHKTSSNSSNNSSSTSRPCCSATPKTTTMMTKTSRQQSLQGRQAVAWICIVLVTNYRFSFICPLSPSLESNYFELLSVILLLEFSMHVTVNLDTVLHALRSSPVVFLYVTVLVLSFLVLPFLRLVHTILNHDFLGLHSVIPISLNTDCVMLLMTNVFIVLATHAPLLLKIFQPVRSTDPALNKESSLLDQVLVLDSIFEEGIFVALGVLVQYLSGICESLFKGVVILTTMMSSILYVLAASYLFRPQYFVEFVVAIHESHSVFWRAIVTLGLHVLGTAFQMRSNRLSMLCLFTAWLIGVIPMLVLLFNDTLVQSHAKRILMKGMDEFIAAYCTSHKCPRFINRIE